MIASWPLQVALYTRLTGHAATSGYTWTDDGQAALPYGQIGPEFGEASGAFDRDGSETTFQIDIWALDSKTCKQMMAAVDTALKSADLDLSASGFDVIGRVERTLDQVLRDYDEGVGRPIRHGVLQYRILIHEQV